MCIRLLPCIGWSCPPQFVFRSSALAAIVPAPHRALFQAWLHMAFAPTTGRWTLARAELDYAHLPANAGVFGSRLEVAVTVVDV